jgi:hypothetical protein
MRASCASILSLALLLLVANGVVAQEYTGTFTVPNDVGGVMTLTLQQQGDGSVSGSLSSNGVTYEVDGFVEEDTLMGAMFNDQGGFWFEAERDDAELYVTLYESDENGEPDYERYTEIDFTFAGASGGAGQAARQPTAARGNPLGGAEPSSSGNPLAGGGATDPYVGQFSDGNVTLRLQGQGGQYQGQVTVGGQVYPVSAAGGPSGLEGLIQTPEEAYDMSITAAGSGLVLLSGGVRYDLARQGAGADRVSAGGGQAAMGAQPGARAGAQPSASGREFAAGWTDNHPQVTEWTNWLAGKKLTRMSSYSSGSAGGYSARTDLYLCSDRSFSYRDESSVSVDVGGAFGNSGGTDGGQGTWYLITNGQVMGLVLEFTNGERWEVRLDYENEQTFANGERVYVTAAEICY